MDRFESICNFMHFNKNDNNGIPPTEKKARPTKRCVVCYKNNRRKETVFWCLECEAALCVEECFKAFHAKLNFLRYDFVAYLKSLDIPEYYVLSFIEIQPLLIKLHYFE